ncbi:MAG: hypothetical protein A3F72_06570 [Bacteroidetes bacterium RIFCSPLOWO2_12_FULL_35_15]|nr:MAG: hypothetical protein A3F72_06570 [Bacteroidetes bacterium RIFCSPLOWO2_12_FULL_35_15]
MKNIFRNIPLEIRYLLKIYFSGILVFTLFRVILVITQWQQAASVSKRLLAEGFLMGLRFDTVVSCYLLSVPAILIIIRKFLKKRSELLLHFSNAYVISLYCIAFFICSVDIPYFEHFLTRVTYSVLNWSDNPMFMFKLVFQDRSNYFFIALFIVLIYSSIKAVKIISRTTLQSKKENEIVLPGYFKNSIYSVLIVLVLVLGIRGRITIKAPIQWGTAFISNNNFVNQLGLNPAFTFFRSYISSKNTENNKIHFIDNTVAINNIQNYLGIQKSNSFSSPIARKIAVTGEPINANVVIVMMESMSLSKTGLDNNPINMTPYLDSLAKVSYTFTNIFSAGIHTYNGIYATLFSMPALMNQHPMMATESSIQPFTGIASTLNQFNYQSTFICPHDEEFDNMSGFLKANGFQKIIGQKDFPSSEIISTMGVPDDVLFEHAVTELNQMAKQPKPFLASILTGSDHKPNYIPTNKGFVPKTKEEKQQIVEYADWSINKFLNLCKKQTWYDNTIFVFIADHGSWYRDFYEMNLSYHKVPLLIFSPKIIQDPKMNDKVGGQIDVFPTIMGLLNRPYINNTMGVDLLKEGRKYICFSADDRIGCVNDTYFWYYNYSAESEYLLHYHDKDPKQYLQQYPLLADTLKKYAHSMYQTAQWLLDSKKVGPQN